jgi:RNA polymerase sigma-32 factor
MTSKTRRGFDLRRCVPLSREDELACASEYARTRAPHLARRLITSNMRLVAKIAFAYLRPPYEAADLIQEGNLGLIQAVLRYDPKRGVKLATYAAWWIRAYILKFTLDNWRLVKAGTTEPQRRLFFNLQKERQALERQGIEADAANLAASMGLKEKDVVVMLARFANNETSLDAPRSFAGKETGTLADTIGDAAALQPDTQLETANFARALHSEMKTIEDNLEGRELAIFRRRIMSENPATLAELAAGFGVTRERARQLECRLKSRIRSDLKRVMGDALEGRGVLAGRQPGAPLTARVRPPQAVTAHNRPYPGRILQAFAR